MSISYLLDSSILVLSLKKNDEIMQRLAEVASSLLYISTITLGELYHGAEHSIQVQKSLAEVNKLTQPLTALPADQDTARMYGKLKHAQQVKGLMIPDNDLWIASASVQYGLTLVARDQHFNWIEGLALEQW